MYISNNAPSAAYFSNKLVDQTLLAGPGIGENDVKIIGIKSQFVVGIVRIGDEPERLGVVVGIGFLGIGFGARGNEAAVNELHGQTKVICKPSGGIDETSLNLNATDR